MPFPITPPAQMPCPHWNHFPIKPAKQQMYGGLPSPPPSPDSYAYCSACGAVRKAACSSHAPR